MMSANLSEKKEKAQVSLSFLKRDLIANPEINAPARSRERINSGTARQIYA